MRRNPHHRAIVEGEREPVLSKGTPKHTYKGGRRRGAVREIGPKAPCRPALRGRVTDTRGPHKPDKRVRLPPPQPYGPRSLTGRTLPLQGRGAGSNPARSTTARCWLKTQQVERRLRPGPTRLAARTPAPQAGDRGSSPRWATLGPVGEPGVPVALSRRRARVQISSGPPVWGASLAAKHAVVARARSVRVRRLPPAWGHSAARKAQAPYKREVPGSNPGAPTTGRRGVRSPRVAWDHESGGSNPSVPTRCPVAQPVGWPAVNRTVAGSSPAGAACGIV